VRLAAAAGRRGVDVVTAAASNRLGAIRSALLATGAGSVLVCGDAATQAAAACVAATLEVAFGCLSAGPTDMLSRDIGTLGASPGRDDDDPAELRLDLGEVNGITFVNYVAIGLDVSPTTHGATIAPAAARDRMDSRAAVHTGSRGAPELARSLLVSNNRFRTLPGGIGARDRLDGGRLAVLVWSSGGRTSDDTTAPASEREVARIELYGPEQVTADVDGISRVLRTPLRFRLIPGAVRLGVRATAWLGASL
jgi:hypothetical protein